MSRFHFSACVDYDENGIPEDLWNRAVWNAIHGRRGQALLRELREALLAMENKRLIDTFLINDWEVCTIGRLAQYRLEKNGVLDMRKSWLGGVVHTIQELEEAISEDVVDELDTQRFGTEVLGMAKSLAWELAFQNDENCIYSSPEARYQHMLDWVNEHIDWSPEEEENGFLRS